MNERVTQQKQPVRRDYPEPDIYSPAMPPLGLLHALERRVQQWRQQRAGRRKTAVWGESHTDEQD